MMQHVCLKVAEAFLELSNDMEITFMELLILTCHPPYRALS